MGTSTRTHGEPIELEPSQQRRIGAHVDEAATRLGTNAKASDALGIGVNVVTKLRRRHARDRFVYPETLAALCHALGLTRHELLHGNAELVT